VLAPLLGAVDALRHTVSLRVNASQEAWHGQVVATVRAALGEQAFAAGWAKGRTMSLDQLVQETLAALEASPSAQGELPAPTRTPRSEELLSPREREVLQLVAEGLTNRQIAETLVISRSTVSFHVTSLLNKLGADTRGQAIALAARRGLL
jgi:DNA-binding NarL/FixJ family response regulator